MQMETNFAYIDENYKRIVDAMEEAKAKYRKPTDEITLMAVTKTVAPEAVNHAISCGIHTLGENRVQEYLSKKDFYAKDAKVHFIGHLQTNKVKYIVGKTALIHSVDSLHLAKEIEKQAAKNNVIVPILIEVNIAEEESKFGIHKEETIALVREVAQMEHVHIRGLMTIAPYVENPEDNRPYFKEIRQLSVDIKEENIDNVDMDVLSMGMTGDYMVAIEEGATLVRVGTGIFGERQYHI